MNFPFKKHVLSQEQREAAIEYVESNFGAVPKAPSDDHMRIVDFLSGEMDKSDLSAWVGHLLTTPSGLFALARIKLGFGAPTTGLQWLGMQLFIDSCVILIDKGYPPAAADLEEPKLDPYGVRSWLETHGERTTPEDFINFLKQQLS